MSKYINADKLIKAFSVELDNISKRGYKTEMEYWYNEGKRSALFLCELIVRAEADEDTGEWIKELADE